MTERRVNILNMVKQQGCVQTSSRFYLRAFLCILVPGIVGWAFYIGRVCFSKSAYASDIGEMLLRWGALAFLCVSTAAAYTLITLAIYTSGAKGAACITGFYALRCLLDTAAQFFTDSLNSGSPSPDRSGYDVILSGVTLMSELFASVALAFGVWIMASAFYRLYRLRECSRKYSLKSAVNCAILIQFAVPFLKMLVRAFTSFVRSNWIPSLAALRAMVRDGLEIVVFYAIIAFISSRAVLALCTKKEF